MSILLTAYKNGELVAIWKKRTDEMIARSPKMSPLRCGELVAARLARQAGNEFAALEAKVNPFSMKDEEVILYDWLADDNYNIKEDLINISGSRTLLADIGNLDIQCPVCLASSPSDEHLTKEYVSMMHAQYGAFRQNAATAQSELAILLLARGITHIPNIFGAMEVRG